MSPPTFAEAYSAQHRLTSATFAPVVLRRTLHAQAWLLTPFFWLLRPDSRHFAADYDLIRAVGALRDQAGLEAALAAHSRHPGNRGFFRRSLRLSLSIARLDALIRQTLGWPQSARTRAAPRAKDQVPE